MIKSFSKSFADKNRFVEIDAIRGVSALIILIHHYTKYIYSLHGEGAIPGVIEYGKYTVQFFFVISGLLIFMTLDRAEHPKYFVVSRFSRLYPAYWVCMTLTALVITISPYYNYHPVTFIQYAANLTLFQHWMHIEDMDGVYWTLAVEMCFYILIFLVFILRKQHKIEQIGMVWLLVMLGVYFLMQNNLLPAINYYYLVPLLKNGDLFIAGIFFYQLKNDPFAKRKYWLILCCLATHFIINTTEESIAIGLIFVVMFLFVTNRTSFLRGKAVFFLGYICYPLYLLHQYIGYEIINFLEAHGMVNIIANIFITGAVIVLTASVVTFMVERPAMKFFRKKLLK